MAPQFDRKPTPLVQVKPTPRTHPPAKVIRAVRLGSNVYRIVEETYDCAPTSVRVIQENLTRVPAEDEVRIQNEEQLGLERFGQSGL